MLLRPLTTGLRRGYAKEDAMRWRVCLYLSFLVLSMAGCTETARFPVAAGTGPHPLLPPPETSLIPTVKIAPARGWPTGASPIAAPGTAVNQFAAELDHPRWLYVLPNGDVLVAETNAPPGEGPAEASRAGSRKIS